MEPPAKRPRKLIEESDWEIDLENGPGGLVKNEEGELEFKINEEYARRFEYNKKREEMQRCEHQYNNRLFHVWAKLIED